MPSLYSLVKKQPAFVCFVDYANNAPRRHSSTGCLVHWLELYDSRSSKNLFTGQTQKKEETLIGCGNKTEERQRTMLCRILVLQVGSSQLRLVGRTLSITCLRVILVWSAALCSTLSRRYLNRGRTSCPLAHLRPYSSTT